MADNNITLKRVTGSGTSDNLYPRTTWNQVLNKPTTFTPTAHSHGQISDTGAITAAVVTPANTDTIVITDSSDNGFLKRGITIGTGTTTFLRNDGTWATPAGGGTVTGTGTANLLTYWTGTSSIGSLSTATYPSLTELSYVKGVTSALQTQLNGKAPTSHATSATTYGVSTNTNYGHTRGLRLADGASPNDGNSGVTIVSGTAYATKTLRVNSIAQNTWGSLLDLDGIDGSLLRFVDVTIRRTEGSITYYIGSIMIDIHNLVSSSSTAPTLSTTTRWRLNSRNSSNAQLTLPIYFYRYTTGNILRAIVDNTTTATYEYECVGYY